MEYHVLTLKTELFRRRCSGLLIWLLVFQPVLAWLTGVLLEIDSARPAKWIGSLEVLVTFSFWIYTFLFCVSAAIFVAFHIRSCTVIPEVRLRRWDSVFNLFLRPSNFLCILGHTILAGFTTRCYLGLVTDDTISGLTSVAARKPCFCDIHFFVVLYGAFSGLLFACSYFVKCKYLLKFTAIQQSRFMQVKTVLSQLMLTALSTVLKQMLLFYVIFLIIGYYSRPVVADVLNISKSCTEPLNSVAGLLSLRLFWTTLVTSFALRLIWDGSIYLANLFLTQAYTFPIEAVSSTDTVPLHVAMATSTVPFTQYLAYLDFCLLSQSSKFRRQILFDLSHPGGHPHNWKCIVNECLALLHQLTAHLNSAGEQIKPSAVDQAAQIQSSGKESSEATLMRRLTGDPPAHSPQHELHGLILQPTHRLAPAVVIKQWIVRKVKQMVASIKHRYISFTRHKNELSRQCLFLGCQPHIWAAEGLSFVAIASLTEDKYGVVQPDLPDIISVLCELQQSLGKQVKWLPSRSTKDLTRQLDARLKLGLNAAVKTALYRIATRFKDHLSSLTISYECQQILQQYASYSK